MAASGWSAGDAESYLSSLEPLGMRFGLERIRKLVSVLGMPQHRFTAIHVVGTNGKSSVTEMIAALCEAHGMGSGAYISPHVERWSERIRIRGAEIAPDAFAAAVERVAEAVETVNRTLDEGDAVTQFEADTAAAFVALAAAGVQIGVIEAGLGGRLDATNVLQSKATVLTSIGLEHTEWLGDTEAEIATEKLAVLRDHTTLVTGRLVPEIEDLARRTAAERNAQVVVVRDLAPAVELPSPAPFLRRNFAVALAAAEVVLGKLDVGKVRDVAGGLELHGRVEVAGADPAVILDAAHNADGTRALAEALDSVTEGRVVIGCMAVLADKDARAMVEALAPKVSALVATTIPGERLARAGRPGARALSAGDLAAVAVAAGIGQVEKVEDPREAVERAVALARGARGAALVCGSHYLLAYA
ncbi:MAG TPA: cyanophycin synthetase [Solirubrobacterales bacterium]|nr:cyanophycin synthetase [Solirubrobacterales bacterium]